MSRFLWPTVYYVCQFTGLTLLNLRWTIPLTNEDAILWEEALEVCFAEMLTLWWHLIVVHVPIRWIFLLTFCLMWVTVSVIDELWWADISALMFFTLWWVGGTTGSASDQQSEGCGFEAPAWPTKVVCITVLTGNRLGWTVRCGRPPLLLPSCRKLEFRLSALIWLG